MLVCQQKYEYSRVCETTYVFNPVDLQIFISDNFTGQTVVNKIIAITDSTSDVNFGDNEIQITIPGNGSNDKNVTNSGTVIWNKESLPEITQLINC